MSRLTSSIRENLSLAVMRHRFAEEVGALVAQKAELADAVYCDIYRKADREKMDALPQGWLPTSSTIGVQLGDSCGYQVLHFSGNITGPLYRMLESKDKKDRVERRVLDKHRNGCARVYAPDHKLSIRSKAVAAVEETLLDRIRTAQRQSDAALNSVSTLAALVKAWPEIEPFAKLFSNAPAKLPAIPTTALNEMFKLPVSEAA